MKQLSINYKYPLLILLILILGTVLRVYLITNKDTALHGDELGVGYNAFAIIRTGTDEYGNRYPLTFRHDVLPVIIYGTVPFIRVFGLNEFATRLPTIVVGLLTVFLFFYFTEALTFNRRLALLSMYLLSISTWHIRTSRLALDMVWGLFFQLMATFIFVKSIKNNSYFLSFFSFFTYLISIYAYQAPKLTTPLLIILMLWIYRKSSYVSKNLRLLGTLFVIFIIIPSIMYIFVRPIEDTRFAGISIFTQWRSNFTTGSPLISYLNPVSLLRLFGMFAVNYLKHFDPRLLFWDNSNLRYHQLSGQGLFYLWQTVFIIVGFIHNLKSIKTKTSKLLLGWLLIAPIPSALTTGVPNANISRTLMLLPVMLIFIAQGTLFTLKYVREKYFKYHQLFQLITTFLVILALTTFIKSYYFVEPGKFSEFWGLPLKKAAIEAVSLEQEVDNIVFTTSSSPQSYMYILFYGNKDPQWLLKNRGERAEIVGYAKMGKYEFRPVNWEEDKFLSNALLIGTPKEIPPTAENIIEEIQSSEEKVSLRIVKTQKKY